MKTTSALILAALAITCVLADVPSKPPPTQCGAACEVCKRLSSFLDIKSCPNCPCLHQLDESKDKKSFKCGEIDTSIYCPLGYEIDEKGCRVAKCGPHKCESANPLKNCDKLCSLGYMADDKGCPVCECQCDSEKLTEDQVIAICDKRCEGSFSIEEDPSGCRICNCESIGRLSRTCDGIATTDLCTKNCSKWGFRGGCSEHPCECQCPRPGLTCTDVKCPMDMPARLIKDSVGCEIRCSCEMPRDHNHPEIEIEANCPQVDCPADCGELGVDIKRDEMGCVLSCQCNCLQAGCKHECPSGYYHDMMNCPTCECLPPPAPIVKECPPDTYRCNNTCGPHGFYDATIGDTDCRPGCACRCKEMPCSEGCLDTEKITDRYGCDKCTCKDRGCGCSLPLNKRKNCGPHGHKLDALGCSTCECNCDSEECPDHCVLVLDDDFGCSKCVCPPKV